MLVGYRHGDAGPLSGAESADMLQAGGDWRGGPAQGRTQGPSLDEAYAILGVPADAGDDEVKRAYRRMMSQHHPDKLVAKGLPEEMMKIATQKTQEIKAAYDRIKSERADRAA